MPYNYKTSKNLDRILEILHRKDKNLYEQVIKKIDEIINSYDIEHYKNLRHDLKEFKRVQTGHFVLIFKFIKNENKIAFVDFDHHDKIYRKKFE
jgi:YafQ family addiction module toxin component